MCLKIKIASPHRNVQCARTTEHIFEFSLGHDSQVNYTTDDGQIPIYFRLDLNLNINLVLGSTLTLNSNKCCTFFFELSYSVQVLIVVGVKSLRALR